MSTLKHRIQIMAQRHPTYTSTQIAERLNCSPHYVRHSWNRKSVANTLKKPASVKAAEVSKTKLHYQRAYSALEDLFIAITEEGYDVEAAIAKAENILVNQAAR